ncbi:MAG: hypothetical protein HY879_20045 [Deltaproteobacteria bacterium]|nr:hypothetical protein [Deltaproteobacteria bacterium]
MAMEKSWYRFYDQGVPYAFEYPEMSLKELFNKIYICCKYGFGYIT